MQALKGKIATVGTFDGVHRGHLVVIETMKRLGQQLGLSPLLITFDRHPLEVVAPHRVPPRIMNVDDENRFLQKLDIEVLVVPFTRQIMNLTAEEWMRKMKSDFGVRALVVGYDNTFGCDGIDLSVSDYQKIGQRLDIKVFEAPVLEGVSSSAIRRAVSEGKIDLATQMLGRPFRLEGKVESGRQLGRTLGFPTANINVNSKRLVPAHGVYACIATLPDGARIPAVVNIGVRPTVNDGLTPTVEAHLLDWSGNLYGCNLNIDFMSRLRAEQKFSSLDELQHQIAIDCLKARKVLAEKL